jgi:hypothetical protein
MKNVLLFKKLHKSEVSNNFFTFEQFTCTHETRLYH